MHTSLPLLKWRGGRASWGVRRTVWLGLSLLLALILIIGRIAPAAAFGSSRLILSGLNTSAFPNVTFSLELLNSSGVFVDNLKQTELLLHEDGLAVQPAGLELQPRRLQFSLAINAAPGLEAKPANPQPNSPTTQLEGIRQSLLSWAAQQTSAGGDFSLGSGRGMEVIRAREPAQLVEGLKAFQPDPSKAESSLFSLTTVLDLIGENGADETAKAAVLFITPPLDAKEASGLAVQSGRAEQSGVVVFVWEVVPDIKAPPPNQEALQMLADATGGKLALVSAESASYPDLESWLKPLRQIYQVSYRSTVQKGSEHTLSAQINSPGLQLSADRELRFKLEVRPPNPMFVKPPMKVERAWSVETRQQPAVLSPQVVPLEVVVEFPDGFPRELKATRLYLNDKLAAENTSEPFNQFNWNLEDLTESAQVKLRVEAVDTLGLSGTSIEIPVEVSVAPKPVVSFLPHISTQGLIAVGAVLLAGVVLGLVILGESRLRKRQSRGAKRRMKDPVTQPVPIPQVSARARKGLAGPSWPRMERATSSPARLVRLHDNEQPAPGSPVSVNRPELTFGSDSHLAIVVLEDASVQALHARLTRGQEGGFLLHDEKSVAGTWVNYVPLNGKPWKLEHGDLIHMGRVMFRFELTNPPPAHEPQVGPVEDWR